MIDAITQEYVTRLSEAGITGDPCDEWEIRDLEQQLRVALPAAFKAFLLLAGKYFDPFVGSQYVLGHDGGVLEIDPTEVQRHAHHGRCSQAPRAFFVPFCNALPLQHGWPR